MNVIKLHSIHIPRYRTTADDRTPEHSRRNLLGSPSFQCCCELFSLWSSTPTRFFSKSLILIYILKSGVEWTSLSKNNARETRGYLESYQLSVISYMFLKLVFKTISPPKASTSTLFTKFASKIRDLGPGGLDFHKGHPPISSPKIPREIRYLPDSLHMRWLQLLQILRVFLIFRC
jgi:hypothetical protein